LFPPITFPEGYRGPVPFELANSKKLKKDFGNYTKDPDQYIQAFQEVTPNFDLTWKNVMLLLSQTLTSLEKHQM
jgi:hypothetical protein